MALFDHNPPSSRAHLNNLFISRKWEHKTLIERIPGEMEATRILAIHGNSRVGKSHLALNVLRSGHLDQDYHLFVVNAAGGRTARQILTDLYEEIRNVIQAITDPAELPPQEGEPNGLGSLGLLDEAREVIAIFDGLITGTESEQLITYSDSVEHSVSYKIAAKILSLSSADKTQQTHTKQVKRSPPNDYQLVNLIRELSEILCQATPRRNVIVYIDDVDLLEIGADSDKAQVVSLTRLLRRLADSPRIAVVASLRTKHLTNSDKDFSEALRVNAMKDADLGAVYQRQIEVFCGKREVFDEACLRELIAFSKGHVGNFLRLCRKFYDWGGESGRTEADALLTVTDLESFILYEVRELKQSKPHLRPALEKILAAVGGEPAVLEVELGPEVVGTELVYTLLEEPTGVSAPVRYDINPFVARVLRDKMKG